MTQKLDNDLFLRALLRQPVSRTPMWIMRQAGRYLPEYRATRAEAGDFMSLCRNAELACEVTMQPLRRYALDAAILFSDILTIPDAMGLGLSFVQGEGPQFAHPVRDAQTISRLGVPDPEDELGYVMDAVRVIRSELDGRVPLIGFAGSPWTLASVQAAASQLQHDVTPIDDLRGTAAYRRLLARNLLLGFFLDSQRPAASCLEDTPTATVTAGGHP